MRGSRPLALLLGAGIAAYYTRPAPLTFSVRFREWLKEELAKSDRGESKAYWRHWLSNAANSLTSSVASALSTVRFETYPFFVLAYITIPGVEGEVLFVGVAGCWLTLTELGRP